MRLISFSSVRREFLGALVIAMMAAMGAGCSHPETGAFAPQSTGVGDLENTAKFVLLDPRTQYSVTASSLQETVLDDGRLAVKANVRNRENRRLQVQIDCQFKDAQGFVTEEMPFKTLILTENAQETVDFTSSNNKASRYTIRVRQAR